jgi:hypothetical protein
MYRTLETPQRLGVQGEIFAISPRLQASGKQRYGKLTKGEIHIIPYPAQLLATVEKIRSSSHETLYASAH